MLTLLAFLGVLIILIFIHELGHFSTAKWSGVQVQEFALGFPPRLLQFRRGETLYTLNLIPLGGFVKMLGEEDPTHPRSLAGQPLRKRTLIISAGALMNAILALVLFSVVAAVPQKTLGADVTIQQVQAGSPAALAGIQPGDIVRKVSGRAIENSNDLRYRYELRLGATATTELERNGQLLKLDVVPRWNPPAGQGAIGISIENANPRTITRSTSWYAALPAGARQSAETLVLMKNGIAKWFLGDSRPTDDLAGPIGIARVTGEVARAGIIPLVTLAAALSLNLAIVNVLPFPALDGGRLFFLLVEFVRRGKRIPPKKEALVHLAGFVILMLGAVIVSYFDIVKITRGEGLFGG